MQFKNPFAQNLNLWSSRYSEKINFNKQVIVKLLTKVCIVRKMPITSEPLVYLKNSTAINPWPMGNPALSSRVARTKGTPLKLRKKFSDNHILYYSTEHPLSLLLVVGESGYPNTSPWTGGKQWQIQFCSDVSRFLSSSPKLNLILLKKVLSSIFHQNWCEFCRFFLSSTHLPPIQA